MVRKNNLILIAFGAVLVCTPAFSEEGVSRHEVSAQFLGQFVKNTTNDGIEQDATYSGGVLGNYRFFFSRHHGVEGTYSWSRSTQQYTFRTSQTGIKSDQHEASGAYIFRIPMRRVTPFATGGAGALIFNPKESDTAERKARPAFVYGGGVDVNLHPRIVIRAQYRGFVYKSPTFDMINSDVARVTHMAQPSVGLGFTF